MTYEPRHAKAGPGPRDYALAEAGAANEWQGFKIILKGIVAFLLLGVIAGVVVAMIAVQDPPIEHHPMVHAGEYAKLYNMSPHAARVCLDKVHAPLSDVEIHALNTCVDHSVARLVDQLS